MEWTSERDSRLRLTPRQRWIFALDAVTTLAVAACAPAVKAKVGDVNVQAILLLFSPWLLGLLIILFDHPSPLRNWMAPLLLSLFYPGLVLWYDGAAIISWARHGQPPAWPVAICLNAVVLGGFATYMASMYPRHCPGCRKRALIPLLRIAQQEQGSSKTRWCALCGLTQWKDRNGHWQTERQASALAENPPRANAPQRADPIPINTAEVPPA